MRIRSAQCHKEDKFFHDACTRLKKTWCRCECHDEGEEE